ncbi:hypothetical protein RF11_10179 [Thelohanellus kitauei]|uniref:Uncharacterized protein n=1 Tax=Thelohanellus kitauei TaxID=669202 RepID=A0A0C2IZM2_THEKT|nr:hypothetical protein RF11_10179 [Thelohanellus kitauei]
MTLLRRPSEQSTTRVRVPRDTPRTVSSSTSGDQPLFPLVKMGVKEVCYSRMVLLQEYIERKQKLFLLKLRLSNEDIYDYLFHYKKISLQVCRDPKEKNSVRPRSTKAILPCYAHTRKNSTRNYWDKKVDGKAMAGSK